MDNLTLEHLSAYLPYGLKAVDYFDGIELKREIVPSNIMAFVCGDTKSKPILRPLSDLTKEIEHNGERFVPIDGLGWNSYENIIKKGICDSVGYQYMIKLFEWHFDVFGLIEKKLAIDINTL